MTDIIWRPGRLLNRLERDVALVAVLCVMAATALVSARAPDPVASAAETYQVMLSRSSDRSDAAALDGQSVSGDAYVFTSPESGVKRVRFYLDDPDRTGSPHQTENIAPYDFAGTASDDTALPFDTTTVADGSHTITAAIELSDGTTQVLDAVFTVANTQPALILSPDALEHTVEEGTSPASDAVDVTTNDASSADFAASTDAAWVSATPSTGTSPATLSIAYDTSGLAPGTHTATITASAEGYASDATHVTVHVTGYALLVSRSADRADPVPLDGVATSGDIYVFTHPDDGVKRVRFYLDDSNRTGPARQTENKAPYDFAGTASDDTALPFDTTTVTDGVHTVTAGIERTDGTVQVLHADVTIDNTPDQPDLVASPDELSFTVETGSTSQQTTSLEASDGSAADASLTDDAEWLTVSPASAITPETLTVTADASSLDPGSYGATIAASASGYTEETIAVSLEVTRDKCYPSDCADVLVDVPYELDFDSDHGFIADADGQGTGFTWVDRPTNGTGYLPENLNLDTTLGVLDLRTTSGIAFRDVNSQDNALSVGFDPKDQLTIVSASLTDPPVGAGNFEQGGIWFGNDEDNYAKLVILSVADGPVIEFHMEKDGADAAKKRSGTVLIGESTVDLTFRIDPTNRTIKASYAIDGGDAVFLGTFTAPEEFFSFDAARIDPEIGTDSFAGVFGTHRNATSPVTYHVDAFSLTGEALQAPPGADPFPFVRRSHTVATPTGMVWGPDDRLYVTEAFGTIHALTFDENRRVVADEVITTLGTRLTLGITVDPASTPDDVILWVSHSYPAYQNAPPNTSEITKIRGPNHEFSEDVITGLPRSYANHAMNNLHFGPDGRLYIAAGGNTGAGAPNDSGSEFGERAEQPLSAAVIVADVKASGFDGTCDNTSDIYGPPPCDVTPWATGLRNIYDFVFHSNGRIYGPDNGLGVTGTFPPSPTPPCTGFGDTASYEEGGHNPGAQPDTLHIIEEGRYYGHPNPYRDECVFKDGSYQGVAPLPNYDPPIFTLGDHKSANGTIEYTADAFGGALQGALLITNYAVGDDITLIQFSADGSSVLSAQQLTGGFNDPLPIAQAPDGTIFVGEFGANRVTALVPDDDKGSWTTKAPMPEAILDAGGTALDGKLYSVGGKTSAGHVSSMRVYDPVADAWTLGPDLPGEAVENPAVAATGGKLYAFGGSADPFSGAVANAHVYDPSTGAWSALPPMPTARGGAAAQAIDGKIYVAGGMDASGASVAVVEVFDTATGSWSTATAMSTRRDNPGSAVLDGKLYLFGGRTRNADGSGVSELASVEAFDPVAGSWTAKAPMPTGRRTMVVGTLNGRAQVMGGEKRSDGGSFAANEEYNPLTNSWRVLAPMQTPRHGAAAGTIDGVVYVAGGGPVGGSSFTDVNEAFAFGS